MNPFLFMVIVCLAVNPGLSAAASTPSIKPIILFILADDLGPIREYTLHQTISLALAIRCGSWKYLDHRGSGGNNYAKGPLKTFALTDSAPNAPGQLYNLEKDPGETTNVYFDHPERVRELKSQLDEFKASGRSRP